MNPFKPTAGKMPPELIGRDLIVSEFVEGLDNGSGAPERLMRITGARGMGKTVMLSELAGKAAARGWSVISETANPGFCTRILDKLVPKTRIDHARVQPSAFGMSLGVIEIERASLTLREAIAKKLASTKKGLIITLDEIQDATLEETRALAVAIQHTITDDGDIAFVFAGLPSMVDNVVNGKTLTFLRRALPEHLGPIDERDVKRSYEETLARSRMSAGDDALELMAGATHGYPFMIQLVGYYAWQTAYRRKGEGAEISLDDAREGVSVARRQFDRMVIEPALNHLAPSLIAYLIAMAQDREAPSRTKDVAERLGKAPSELSSYRSRLIKENVIESRARGEVSFAIPYMAEYLLDHRDEISLA